MSTISEVKIKAQLAAQAAAQMNRLNTQQKNEALEKMAQSLIDNQAKIIEANKIDLQNGKENGTSPSLLDRLALDEARIAGIADGLRQLIALPDPVGKTLAKFTRPNGLEMEQITVPLGVIGIIYEARPNVTVDAAGLCLKTGNCVVLRGGSAALASNRMIVETLRGALAQTDMPVEALQIIEDSDRASVNEMLKLNRLLDVLIPRGGASLIRNVVENATVPVIETGAGICHTYVAASANVEMATQIAMNAKAQRPSVCNAMETLLLDRSFAKQHAVQILSAFKDASVELRGDQLLIDQLGQEKELDIKLATEEDYATEYNDYILNIRIVDSLDEALAHIHRYGTKHSECIVTEDAQEAARFQQDVDAAAVYHNASTRFTDGFEFGFGAEIGISTQKLHARGPMGLPALTSTKYLITGNGQIRG